jgi:hypothetical protein
LRRRSARGGRFRLGGQYRGHRNDVRQGLDGALGRLAQRLKTRSALRLDLDRKPDIAVADHESRHHAKRDNVAIAVGVAHRSKRVEDVLFGDRHALFLRGVVRI